MTDLSDRLRDWQAVTDEVELPPGLLGRIQERLESRASQAPEQPAAMLHDFSDADIGSALDAAFSEPQQGASSHDELDQALDLALDRPVAKVVERPATAASGVAKEGWFVGVDDQQVGPLTLEKVQRMWDDHELDADALCWRAGMKDWIELSRVPELFATLSPQSGGQGGDPGPSPVSAARPAAQVPSLLAPVGPAEVALAAAPSTSPAPVPSSPSVPTVPALSSLVQDEIASLVSRPQPVAPAPPQPAKRDSLLDVPTLAAAAPPQAQPLTYPHPVLHPLQPVGVPSHGLSRGVLIAALSLSALAVVALAVVVTVLVLRPQERQNGPVLVAAAPTSPVPAQPTAPTASAGAPAMGQVGSAPAPAPAPSVEPTMAAAPGSPPVAAAPGSPPVAAAPGSPPVAAAPGSPPVAAAPGSPPVAVAAAPGSPPVVPVLEPAASPPARTKSKKGSGESGRAVARTEAASAVGPGEEVPAPAPSTSEDEFAEEFGNKAPTPASTGTSGKAKTVYVPPAPGEASVKPTLADSDVMEVVLSHKDAIGACAAEQRKRAPELSGKLVMQWTVQTSGKTSNVNVVSDEYKAAYIAGCVAAEIKKWRFPAHATAREPIVFPFKF